jgi:hypothetical protein
VNFMLQSAFYEVVHQRLFLFLFFSSIEIADLDREIKKRL